MSSPPRAAKRRLMASLVVYWAPVVACMALICYLSFHPSPMDLGPVALLDNWGHTIAYAVLGMLLVRAMHGSAGYGLPAATACSALGATAYGILNEVGQLYVPNRHATAPDALADAIGAMLGAVAFIAGTGALSAWRRRARSRAWYRDSRSRLTSARQRALRQKRNGGRTARARRPGQR